MERVRFSDGTIIALDRSGNGPPLVIVVGAFCDRSTSKSLAALLGASYTVYEYDRRAFAVRHVSKDRLRPGTAHREDAYA
jgi:hypothetical protein